MAGVTGGHKQDLDSAGAYVATSGAGWWDEDDQAQTLRAEGGGGSVHEKTGVVVAAPLTAGGRNENGSSGPAGRRLEDDVNLVSAPVTAKWAKGNGGPAGDEVQNLTFVKRHGANTADDHETWDEADIARALNGMGQAGTNGALVGAYNLMPENGQGADLQATETDQAAGIDVTGLSRSTDRGTRIVTEADRGDVRRLTPTECERLQALPDGWTYPFGPSLRGACGPFSAVLRGLACPVDHPPDGPRYAACGDAVTANVAEWIAGRIARVRAA